MAMVLLASLPFLIELHIKEESNDHLGDSETKLPGLVLDPD